MFSVAGGVTAELGEAVGTEAVSAKLGEADGGAAA
jgi:hypothetical protein